MMRDVSQLVRLQKHRVDEQRQEIARCQERVQKIQMDIAMLDAGLETEREVARTDELAGRSFPSFAERCRQVRAQLLLDLAAAEEAVEAAREVLRSLFEEQKRYEQAQAQYEAYEAAEARRREQQLMDEAGAIGFIRKNQRER